MIFGKWDERAAYSRQAVPVSASAMPVAPPSAAVVPNALVENKPSHS